MTSDHFTPRQVAEMIGINQQEVYRAIHRGELPAIRRRGYKGRMGRIFVHKSHAREFAEAAFVVCGGVNEGMSRTPLADRCE